ncbi:MAG: hypothetical protein IJO96_02140 [Oscillospiraceae bacterium]|nr:hypothetical protein [Oscillospiraceae bacterium]
MKKLTALILVLVCMFGLAGCSPKNTEKGKAVFETENIESVTFYSIAPKEEIKVPEKHLAEIAEWLGTFKIAEKAGDILPPGADSKFVTIEYSDGTVVYSSLSTITVDGTVYLTEHEREPECYFDLADEDLSAKTQSVMVLETTVCYANWSEDAFIYNSALNADKMIAGAKHFPIFKMDTKQDVEQFKADFGEILSMNQGYNEIPSFEEAISKYDEAFFEENSLLIVYVDAGSGSFRFDADNISCDEESLCVHIRQKNNPEVCTADMAGWFVMVAVKDSEISCCKSFDADFVGIIE